MNVIQQTVSKEGFQEVPTMCAFSTNTANGKWHIKQSISYC